LDGIVAARASQTSSMEALVALWQDLTSLGPLWDETDQLFMNR
jgi:hypothetical protein